MPIIIAHNGWHRGMLIVFCNGSGKFFTDFLPDSAKMGGTYSVQHELIPVSDACYSGGTATDEHPVTLYCDDASIHVAQKTRDCLVSCGLEGTVYPPDSPDLAP
jgi:hypothetical protein